MTFGSIFHPYQARVENKLDEALSWPTSAPSLKTAMRYSTLGGGKRLRPLLVYLSGHCLGADLDDLDDPACAVELIHCYSLVHDDLPAMDNDTLRRGKATCHIAFGEATAILAGDALQTLAFSLLARSKTSNEHPKRALAMIATLAEACGMEGMAAGQALDLESTGLAPDITHLERIHRAKTGALFCACVKLGIIASGTSDPSQINALEQYAEHIGLAFQIQDDLLDVTQTTEHLGKAQGADQHLKKATYVSLLGLEKAREKVVWLHEAARQSLQNLGREGELLMAFTDELLQRTR